jgi:hypothetical protein
LHADGTACDNGDPCIQDAACAAGVCEGQHVADGVCDGAPLDDAEAVTFFTALPGPPPRGSAQASATTLAAAIANGAGNCPMLAQNLAQDVFSLARGPRWLPDPNPRLMNANRDRRSSFLYPQDGCSARADAMAYYVQRRAALGKIFAFSAAPNRLTVNTANVPGGVVAWWYHVADCYQNPQGNVMVIDPSLFPNSAVTAANWVGALANAAQVVICNTGTYAPSDPCNAPAPAMQAWYDRFSPDQRTLLNAEWNNVVALGRNPQTQLTTSPQGWLPAGMLP